MACATLKRSPDWEAAAGLQQPAKRRRCAPLPSSPSSRPQPQPPPSPFAEPSLRITPDQLAQEICDEIKRLQHRRQMRMMSPTSTTRADSDGSSSGSEGDSPRPSHTRALFTFKQVRMICERMLREQEAALRVEYEAALSGKLAEQYESFVRFNLDHVQRRHYSPQDVSYLS